MLLFTAGHCRDARVSHRLAASRQAGEHVRVIRTSNLKDSADCRLKEMEQTFLQQILSTKSVAFLSMRLFPHGGLYGYSQYAWCIYKVSKRRGVSIPGED